MKTYILVFDITTPCSLVGGYQQLRESCCVRLFLSGTLSHIFVRNINQYPPDIQNSSVSSDNWLGIEFISFPKLPNRPLGPPSPPTPAQAILGFFPWGSSGRGVKLTNHLHLVPRLRMSYTSTPHVCILPWHIQIFYCFLRRYRFRPFYGPSSGIQIYN